MKMMNPRLASGRVGTAATETRRIPATSRGTRARGQPMKRLERADRLLHELAAVVGQLRNVAETNARIERLRVLEIAPLEIFAPGPTRGRSARKDQT